MKINLYDHVAESLGVRVAEGTHLIHDAVLCYGFKAPKKKEKIRRAANKNRKFYAQEGNYLKALIHDQIYRLHGGED